MTDECRPLTVRETFAAAALSGILAGQPKAEGFISRKDFRALLARDAVQLADALIAELNAVSVPVTTGREDGGETN